MSIIVISTHFLQEPKKLNIHAFFQIKKTSYQKSPTKPLKSEIDFVKLIYFSTFIKQSDILIDAIKE
jgi:hypothetical protein